MKKILFASFLVIGIYGCGSSSGEKTKKEIETQRPKVSVSAEDMQMQEWMKGKIWTAEDDMAPMSMLKLKADGTYELKSDKNPSTWQIIGGSISLARLTEWPVEKIDDKTFRLYVKPTDKWYTYKHTENL